MTTITTITSKSQITLPKKVRQALNLRPQDRLLVTVQGDRIILIPIRTRPLSDLFGALPVDTPPPDVHKIRQQRHRETARRIVEGEE